MSMIFCGRGTTVRICTPGGVTLLVAVVFELSFDCWQPVRIKSKAQQATMAAGESFERFMVVLQKRRQRYSSAVFTFSLITKSGQGTSPARRFCGVRWQAQPELWSAPAERSGDGALGLSNIQS